MRKNAVLNPRKADLFGKLPFSAQMKILLENRTDIDPAMTPYIFRSLLRGLQTDFSAILTSLLMLQKSGRRLKQDPIFILGHWRSGTTWLHELLLQDPRFVAPGTLECIHPHSFRLDRAILNVMEKLHLVDLSPVTRPMDNVKITLDSPMEDELALLALGVPTQARRSFFFQNYGPFRMHQGWEWLSPKRTVKASKVWIRFLSVIEAKKPGAQLLLKSPHHSWRVALIRKLFPKAKFVLIVRKPEDVYRSFQDMLSSFYLAQSLSKRKPEVSEAEFLENYTYMHNKVLHEMEGISEHSFTIVRYEDLKRDTISTIGKIYQDLSLPDVQAAQERIAEMLAVNGPFKPHLKTKKTVRLSGHGIEAYRAKFGYVPEEDTGSQAAKSDAGNRVA